MTSEADVLWQRAGEVLWRRSGDALVLKTPEAPDLTTLTGSGAELWSELEQPVTLPTIADRLGERFDVEPRTVVDALRPVLDDLERRHLVHRRCA